LRQLSVNDWDTILTDGEAVALDRVKRGLDQVPKTLSALKGHPVFTLERFLTRYDALKPEARPITTVTFVEPVIKPKKDKNASKAVEPTPVPLPPKTFTEAVYLKADVIGLHTRSRWVREGRQVRASEIDHPFKVVPAKRKNLPDVALYGPWQTNPFLPVQAEGGKVPKNDHGNVELFHPDNLPLGTVHIDLPRVSITARKLGIDYAVAMTGFEVRGGRSVPRMEGIVVCSEFKDQLLAAYKEAEEKRLQNAETRREKATMKLWKHIISKAIAYADIKKKYAHGAFGEGAIRGQPVRQSHVGAAKEFEVLKRNHAKDAGQE
jgi:xeroderma pigmentosum group C-complementing protein